MKLILIFAIFIVVAYAAMCLLLLLFQKNLLYIPYRKIEATPDALALPYEPFTVTTRDGVTVSGWYVPAAAPLGTVLFCHGNAGNISHRLDTIAVLNRLRYTVCIFDYRGYGKSTGSPDEAGTYLDAAAVYHWLRDEKGVAPEKLILHGRSLGGAVAARTARDKPCSALVLESTFISVPDLASDLYPWLPARSLTRFSYATREIIGALSCPVLIVHSPEDEIIPFRHGEELFRAARAPKQFLRLIGDHNGGFIMSGDHYRNGLRDFFTRRLGAAS